MWPSREPCEHRRVANRRARFFGAFPLFAIAIGVSFLYRQSRLTIRDSSYAPQNNCSQRRLTDDKPLRILYIVTSLAEFNNGRRFTTRGDDRVANYMMPVLMEGVESMLSFGYRVDLYLICHWTMTPKRREMIRSQLPAFVGLEVWDDATPLGYKLETDHKHTDPVTRGLARQHRYVIKDKLLDYDFFVVFEDDMLVKGDHVQQYLKMTDEISRLRALAPENAQERDLRKLQNEFHAPLSKMQLSRMIPGLVRVEVLRTEDQYGAQNASEMDPIFVDLEFDGVNRTVDPGPCCHLSNKTVSDHIPPAPPSNKLFVWETGIKGLSVRQLPNLEWVGLLGGSKIFTGKNVIGSYWSGRDGAFGNAPNPEHRDPRFLNNQGGWMATRQQIWEWHTEHCLGGFLPPFDSPHFPLDGLDLRNVEFWSGGIHIFSFYNGCNMQRIVSLEPDGFSRHLVYHSANNKQRQLTARGKRERFVKVDNLLGQLNTVKKNAQRAKRKELAQT